MGKYLPSQIAPAVVGLVSIPILTRLYSPEHYGHYILALASINVLTTVVGWLGPSTVRFYPAYLKKGKLTTFYSSVLGMTILTVAVLTGIGLLLLAALSGQMPSQLSRLLYVGIPAFVLAAFFLILSSVLRARRYLTWYSVFSVWKSATSTGFGLVLVMLCGVDIRGLLWGIVISCAIALPFLCKISLRGTWMHVRSISATLIRDMAKYGFPLVVGNVAGMVLSIADRYILASVRCSQEVGIYSASYGISQRTMSLIGALFAFTSGSLVYRVWERHGEERSREFINTITRLYLLIGIPAATGLSVLAKPLLQLLAGSEYHEGFKIVPLVVFGAFLLGLQQRFHSSFMFYHKTHLIMGSIVVCGVLNVGLNLLFVPSFGYTAAAVVTLVSYACLLVLIVVTSRRVFVWPFPFRTLVNGSCAAAGMGAVVYFTHGIVTPYRVVNLFVSVFLGIVLYGLLLLVFREFRRHERHAALQAVQRILTRKRSP